MQKFILFIFVLCVCTTTMEAQPDKFSTTISPEQPKLCNCGELFKALTQKLEANYIAFHLTKKDIEATYIQRKSTFQGRADTTQVQDCAQLLQDFLAYFRDGHLFVVEFPKFSATDMAETKQYLSGKKMSVNELTFDAQNPFEGYWTDGSAKYGIVRQKGSSDKWVAVIVQHSNPEKIGEIKFEVKKTEAGWVGHYFAGNYSSRFIQMNLSKNDALLTLTGGIQWGRLQSSNEDMYNPSLPTVKKIDDNNVLITIPSFLIEGKDFNQLLIDNQSMIGAAKNAIIDIRGNFGGNGIYFPLINAYYDKPYQNEVGYTVSSEDNMAYFEKICRQKQK
jgi:hypothetical protein